MAAASAISNKEYLIPLSISRRGCPCALTPTYRISTTTEQKRTELVHQFTTMRLVHQAKDGEIKNSLDLDRIHHELEIDSLLLQGSGASNILLCKMSFDCLIRDSSGKEQRDYLTFDLRIPGTNAEDVFSYDLIVNAYGTQAKLYEALKYFYSLGRSIDNLKEYKHGHSPEYDASTSKHDQYIRHTEQLLVAYLALPQAAKMLSNRLRIEIRGKYPYASAVKVYNVGLHMHSTKTCCAPCEYSLLGLMNKFKGSLVPDLKNFQDRILGLIPNLMRSLSVPNDTLSFTSPKHSLFRMVVTVTASEQDAHHRKKPDLMIKALDPNGPLPFYAVEVKKPSASKRIFTSILAGKYDRRLLPSASTLNDKTVSISGSRATPGSQGTITKVSEVRKEEMREFERQMSCLKIS
ncbi:MAG: hypothetical protein A2098_00730 [Chlamydiae bacterium GWF2_49_8]|nr:MAG: hypothetical protein A2098_00730 [Chlamydiae bacterium GWF2_49_8]